VRSSADGHRVAPAEHFLDEFNLCFLKRPPGQSLGYAVGTVLYVTVHNVVARSGEALRCHAGHRWAKVPVEI
jgi:hypothetical protein